MVNHLTLYFLHAHGFFERKFTLIRMELERDVEISSPFMFWGMSRINVMTGNFIASYFLAHSKFVYK